MELNLLHTAIMVIAIAIGVTVRSYVPYLSKLQSGEVKKFDWHYIASAVWAFIMSVLMNLATAWLLFKDFDVSMVENFILLIALGFLYGFGGTDLWNRIMKHYYWPTMTDH